MFNYVHIIYIYVFYIFGTHRRTPFVPMIRSDDSIQADDPIQSDKAINHFDESEALRRVAHEERAALRSRLNELNCRTELKRRNEEVRRIENVVYEKLKK